MTERGSQRSRAYNELSIIMQSSSKKWCSRFLFLLYAHEASLFFSQARIVRGPPTFRQRKRCRQREKGREMEGGRKHNISYFSDLLPWHVALSSNLRRMSEPTIIYNTHTLPPVPAPDRASCHFTALHSPLPFWTPLLSRLYPVQLQVIDSVLSDDKMHSASALLARQTSCNMMNATTRTH